MFVDVNVGGGDAESSSNFGDGPLFEDIEVKHLKLFWLEAGLQPLVVGNLIERLSKQDTDPSNNPQPPEKYRQRNVA